MAYEEDTDRGSIDVWFVDNLKIDLFSSDFSNNRILFEKIARKTSSILFCIYLVNILTRFWKRVLSQRKHSSYLH